MHLMQNLEGLHLKLRRLMFLLRNSQIRSPRVCKVVLGLNHLVLMHFKVSKLKGLQFFNQQIPNPHFSKPIPSNKDLSHLYLVEPSSKVHLASNLLLLTHQLSLKFNHRLSLSNNNLNSSKINQLCSHLFKSISNVSKT